MALVENSSKQTENPRTDGDRRRSVERARSGSDDFDDRPRSTREEEWRRENAEAIKVWNAYIEENGVPLSEYRLF